MYIIYSYQYASSICDVSCLCSLDIFHVLLCKWVLSEKYEEKKLGIESVKELIKINNKKKFHSLDHVHV